MEPTIYKPSIYKGAGIYKAGAEGGSGGGGAVQFSSIWFSQEESLNLPQILEKANLCIIFSFVRAQDSITMLKLYNGASDNGYVNIGSDGALRVNNETASYSNEIAINSADQSVIIRQGSYRRFEEYGFTDHSCPYQNDNIDKITVNGTIKRIAFYYGAINDFVQDNKSIDFRPCIEEGLQGFKDIVSGNFYQLSNCTVSP